MWNIHTTENVILQYKINQNKYIVAIMLHVDDSFPTNESIYVADSTMKFTYIYIRQN